MRPKTMAFMVDEATRQKIRKLAFDAGLTPSGYLYRLVRDALRRGIKVEK